MTRTEPGEPAGSRRGLDDRLAAIVHTCHHNGRGQVALHAGAAGIGKTTIVARMAEPATNDLATRQVTEQARLESLTGAGRLSKAEGVRALASRCTAVRCV